MNIGPQEDIILDVFRRSSPMLRFHQIAGVFLAAEERMTAVRALVDKGVLARLADGEYWLTEEGVYLLTLA